MGAKVKNMYILAIVAIVFVLIMHMIMWMPIVGESNEVREKWSEHNRNSIGCPDVEECGICEGHDENLTECNVKGAEQWRETATYCALIALGGAVVYGVGVLVEAKYPADPED